MNARPGALGDFRGSEPDAVVDHVHPRVDRARRDLLGAVRMPVEARLTNQEPDSSAELQRNALDLFAQRVETGRLLPRPGRDACRSAKLAVLGPKGVAPFAGGHAGL